MGIDVEKKELKRMPRFLLWEVQSVIHGTRKDVKDLSGWGSPVSFFGLA